MAKTKVFDQYSDRYERWFEKNRVIYLSELEAIKKIMPSSFSAGIEIGVGSGLFSSPLSISEGIEPSKAMRDLAIRKGIRALDSVAEKLPYQTESKDLVLMVTTICFVDDLDAAIDEVFRVLKKEGAFIIGFVDKESLLGLMYLKRKDKSLFYKEATFYGAEELINKLAIHGFNVMDRQQTLFGDISQIDDIQPPCEGTGKGGFVVLKAIKNQ